MATDRGVQSGFLVLADITGYTVFLTENELEHAQGIIEDLTRAILAALTPSLTLVKLEGDAVFAHAPDGRLSGDCILDVVERAYCDFADSRDDMERLTTCTCSACTNIPSLDLKFVVHHGEYVTHRVAGAEDLAGPDVILVHRLLKNGVCEATGHRAYALITEPATATVPGLELTGHTEHVHEFGAVPSSVLDLEASLRRIRDSRRVSVEASDCDFVYRMHLPVKPAEAWEWWTNPALVPQWQKDVVGQRLDRRGGGRRGTGASTHCAHGGYETLARFLDWRPFEYYTAERTPLNKHFKAPPPLTETVEFVPREDGGTDVEYRCRMHTRNLKARLEFLIGRPFATRQFRKNECALQALLAAKPDAQEDAGRAAGG